MSLHPDAKPPYVRGASDRTYRIDRGIAQIDEHLRGLRLMTTEHPDLAGDVDDLLDARHELAAREKEEA